MLKNKTLLMGLILLILSMVYIDGGCMSRNELTKDEKDLLSNVEEFNKNYGTKGWDLKNREIKNFKLEGIKLYNSTIKNVFFYKTKINDAEFRNVEFIKCDFTKFDFYTSNFEGCSFKDCGFFYDAYFEKCNFKNCEFNGVKTKIGGISKSKINDCVFNKTILDHFKLYTNQIENTSFNKCELKSTAIGRNSSGKNLEFNDCFFDGMGFVGEFKNMSFYKCNSKSNIGIGASNIDKININNCVNFSFAVGDTTSNNIVIKDSENISLLSFLNLKHKNLIIENCKNIENFEFLEVELSGENVIKNSGISRIEVEKTSLKNLSIENTTFNGSFYLKEAGFENVKLKDVKYGDKFKVVKYEDVEYVDSDKFPEK